MFSEKENLLKLVYQMLSVLNTSAAMTEDMANQLIKNLIFLQGQLLSQCSSPEDETYVKTYRKASFIGRKIIGEQTTEATLLKLEAIVQFFTASTRLFSTQPLS